MMFQIYSLAHEMLKNNFLQEDEDLDDTENILDGLQAGDYLGPGIIPNKKISKGGTVLGIITKRLERMSGDPLLRHSSPHC